MTTFLSAFRNIKCFCKKTGTKGRCFWQKYVTLDARLDMSDEEIREKYVRQRESKDWTLYSERSFIENLFSTRFNYFIAALSIFATVAARIESAEVLCIVLFCGTTILILMALAIYRVYAKLIIILKMLYRLPDYHVFPMIDRETDRIKKGNQLLVPVNSIIGVIIPFIGCLIFVIYFFITLFRVFLCA